MPHSIYWLIDQTQLGGSSLAVTVCSSTTVTPLIVSAVPSLNSLAPASPHATDWGESLPKIQGAVQSSQVHRRSSAVSGLPSVQVASGCSLMVTVAQSSLIS